jgi:UrcA family protein
MSEQSQWVGVGEEALLAFQKGIDMRALSIALIASLALTAPVQADSLRTVDVRIPYGDLDLSTAEGVAKFKQRSVVAIRRACAPDAFGLSAYPGSSLRCQRDAMTQAMLKIEEHRQTTLALLTKPVG